MAVAEEPQKYCITFDNVLQAAERIKGVAHRTPVLTSRSLIINTDNNSDQQPQYFFKVEAMQKTGSFKFRGALNAVKAELEKLTSSNDSHNDTFPSAQPLSVVTHSSGNHAQALALASKLASTPSRPITATIVMPLNTPTVKKAAVADFGGQIVMVASTNEAREEEADRIVATTGAAFVHPSEDPRVIAGQGTVCLEFVEQVRELRKMSMVGDSCSSSSISSSEGGILDAVVIPVGGGGLAAGNIITLRALLGDSVKVKELDFKRKIFPL
jgi:serine racemase